MTTTTPTPIDTVSTDSPDVASPTETASDLPLRHIGIEFEYPVAASAEMAPATTARGSSSLRSEVGTGNTWTVVLNQPGTMTRDHVGAEIISDVLDIYSETPEEWYTATIREAARRGYPFAACGYGDTTFGLHMHVDRLSEDEWGRLREFCNEDMAARVFFCASVTETALDPWRHSGASGLGPHGESMRNGGDGYIGRTDRRGPDGHYEFRLPEPMMPDHFSMVMNFWRLFGYEGIETAINYARERVDERDPRLTPIQQYRMYRDRVDGWPYDTLATLSSQESSGERRHATGAHTNDQAAIDYMLDLMED